MLEPCLTSQPCLVHGQHIPASHANHRHHVWPLGDGGPDIAANVVVVCPTGHYNIHTLLDEYRIRDGQVSYTIARRFARGERDLALLGWERITRKAM